MTEPTATPYWRRIEPGFYRLMDPDTHESLATVARTDDGWRTHDPDKPWLWLVFPTTTPGHERTLAEAQKAVMDRHDLMVHLPGIISGGVQRLMHDETIPDVAERARQAVSWIESWVRVEVSVLG